MSNISKKLQLDGLSNTRDLGGIVNRNGQKIIPGHLYRSGALFDATKKDIGILERLSVRCIYDFRTDVERSEKPDPAIPGAKNLHIPILSDAVFGISHEEAADRDFAKALMSALKNHPCFGTEVMENSYTDFILNEHCRKQYALFLSDLLERARDYDAADEPWALLWHCTGGKDRAGFAAVILLEILGVSREDIMADYLSTNLYIRDEMKKLHSRLDDIPPMDERISILLLENARAMSSARPEYLERSYQCIEGTYGSFQNYLTDGLDIGRETQSEFRKIFLSDPI